MRWFCWIFPVRFIAFQNQKGSSDAIMANLITTGVLNANLFYMYPIWIWFWSSDCDNDIKLHFIWQVNSAVKILKSKLIICKVLFLCKSLRFRLKIWFCEKTEISMTIFLYIQKHILKEKPIFKMLWKNRKFIMTLKNH